VVLSDKVLIQNKSHHYLNPVTIRVEDNTFVIAIACGTWFADNFEPVSPERFSQPIHILLAAKIKGQVDKSGELPERIILGLGNTGPFHDFEPASTVESQKI
jgi:hypothetical protein